MECANQNIAIENQVYASDFQPFEILCGEVLEGCQTLVEERTLLIDQLVKLQEGMLFHQVVELIGHPDKVECLGEGVWFLYYFLPEKSQLRIVLKPGLLWAKLFVSETEVRVVA